MAVITCLDWTTYHCDKTVIRWSATRRFQQISCCTLFFHSHTKKLEYLQETPSAIPLTMQLKNITLLFAAFACAAIAAPGGDAPIKARQLPELDTSANVASAAEDTLIRSKRQNIQNPCPE